MDPNCTSLLAYINVGSWTKCILTHIHIILLFQLFYMWKLLLYQDPSIFPTLFSGNSLFLFTSFCLLHKNIILYSDIVFQSFYLSGRGGLLSSQQNLSQWALSSWLCLTPLSSSRQSSVALGLLFVLRRPPPASSEWLSISFLPVFGSRQVLHALRPGPAGRQEDRGSYTTPVFPVRLPSSRSNDP